MLPVTSHRTLWHELVHGGVASYYKDPLVGITQALGVVGKVLEVITTLTDTIEGVAPLAA